MAADRKELQYEALSDRNRDLVESGLTFEDRGHVWVPTYASVSNVNTGVKNELKLNPPVDLTGMRYGSRTMKCFKHDPGFGGSQYWYQSMEGGELADVVNGHVSVRFLGNEMTSCVSDEGIGTYFFQRNGSDLFYLGDTKNGSYGVVGLTSETMSKLLTHREVISTEEEAEERDGGVPSGNYMETIGTYTNGGIVLSGNEVVAPGPGGRFFRIEKGVRIHPDSIEGNMSQELVFRAFTW
tara:strand:+ start:90 stop:806 length:717 start_codon:yes stop_codon:yes gene_type:complete